MSVTTTILRALIASAALLQMGVAQAEVKYTSTLHQGYYASTGQVMVTPTGGSYSLSSPYWSMQTSGSPANNGTAEASFAAVTSGNQIWAGTNIEYIIRLSGPDNVLIPIHITASGNVSGFGDSFHAAASFNMFSGEQGTLVNEGAVVYLYGQSRTEDTSATLSVDRIVNIRSNTDVYVSLGASAGTYSDTLVFAAGGHAFIDPQFVIDPAYASQYAFVGLPVATVPEPSSVVLLALGGGVLAFAKRKRRPELRV